MGLPLRRRLGGDFKKEECHERIEKNDFFLGTKYRGGKRILNSM